MRGMFTNFAMIAIINGMSFDQGTGRTKKEAKIAAADIAFKKLLGINAEDTQNEIGSNSIITANIFLAFHIISCFDRSHW